MAIQMGNARILCGKPIKCSWGSKPTPPRTSSTSLPPPTAAHMPGISATDLAAYERQMALSKMGGAQALMHPQEVSMLLSRQSWEWVLLELVRQSMMVGSRMLQQASR
ncbi:hypothetical protein L1049_006031 [Liquidambar formosana]|uniref:Uncharacterized protein n=1 Tax=Liquidambar formosana TaxID=63359 RepID=A0AAP0RGD7_LIQFO